MVPPESFSPEAWHQLLLDTDSFFQRWAEQAELLAWSDKDLIGVHPRAPAARYDAMGLLFLIRGGEVIELHDQCATIRSQRGSLLVYRKYGLPALCRCGKLARPDTFEILRNHSKKRTLPTRVAAR
jgi:hypothetical protein